MSLWCHLLGQTVLAIVLLSHDPLDKPSIHTSACAPGALPSNLRQLALHAKHLGKSVNYNNTEGAGENTALKGNVSNVRSTRFIEEWPHTGYMVLTLR